MNDPSTLLSVVVPTKNRAHTAASLVESLLERPARELEVVVQDCSDNDELERALERFRGDARLAYEHGPPVSMTENWNVAMTRVRGEYTVVLGDDDGCGERILAAARWALDSGLDWIAWRRASRYYWPRYPVAPVAGQLIVDPCTATYERLDPIGELSAASRGYGESVTRLPMAYHGLVRTRCLHALRDYSGQYFKGVTPDYYSAFALAGHVRDGVVFDFPFSILGSSASSNTAKTASLGYRNAPTDHLDEYGSVEWPDILPDLRLIRCVLAEAMITGLQSANHAELIANIDLAAIYADYIYDHPLQLVQIARRYLRASRQLGRDARADLWRLARRTPSVAKVLLRQDVRRFVFTLLKREVLWTGESPTRRPAQTICEATALHDGYFRDAAERLPF